MFIYGTLKTGEPNDFILRPYLDKCKAELLGRATTFDCWPLIVYTSFNNPFLLDCKGTGKASASGQIRSDIDLLRVDKRNSTIDSRNNTRNNVE